MDMTNTNTVRLIRTMIHGWYLIEVDGSRIGEVEQCRSPFWSGARWAGRLYDFPTRFDCDSQGHSTRAGALEEMMRFWTELENLTRGME